MAIARTYAPPSVAGWEPSAPPPASALKVVHVDYATEELGLSEEAAQDKTKAELINMEEEALSAGSSSSASESKQDKSGSTPPETEQSTRPPAQDAENPSETPRTAAPKSGSSVSSTAGASRGTGPSQPSQQTSSARTSSKKK